MEPHETATPPALTSVHKPYRWGKFQGWLLIVFGLLMASTVVAFLVAPNSREIQLFAAIFSQVNDFGLGFVNTGREMLYRCQLGDVAGGLAMLLAYLLQTVGTGIGLLKKRTFGLALFLFLAVRAVTQGYLASFSFVGSFVALAFTLGSFPYYYKRWRDFRIP